MGVGICPDKVQKCRGGTNVWSGLFVSFRFGYREVVGAYNKNEKLGIYCEKVGVKNLGENVKLGW